jgi:O-acetyl-ADP-ribose deacetylase (regulator of RNase III)
MPLKILEGDITKLENVDAIVNAANAFGVMGAGVAGAIAKSAGYSDSKFSVDIHKIVRDVIKSQGPFEAGDVYISDSGLLKRRGINYLYHAVTMKYPGGLCSISTVDKLTRNVCETAIANNLKSIAMGGLGCGIGGLDVESVANRMSSLVISYINNIDVYIVDINPNFIKAFKQNFEKYK